MFPTSAGISLIGKIAEERIQRPLSRAIGLRHRLKKDFRALDRTGSTYPVDFPSPGHWKPCRALYDNREIRVFDHGRHAFRS
jgi:hypothetical protein